MLDEDVALSSWLKARADLSGPSTNDRSTDEFVFDRGARPVLVTALHATEHVRAGAVKPAEAESGALAVALSEAAGYGRFIAVGPQSGDANFDQQHPFRAHISRLLASYSLVLDLHIMRNTHGPDLCLALGPQPDDVTGRLASLAAFAGESIGLAVSVNWPFRAPDPTLTAFIQANGTSAMQLEIALRLQQPVSDPRNAERLLEWFIHLDTHIAAVAESRGLAAAER